MSSDKPAEFLVELNDTDSLAALRGAHSQKSVLVFKVDAYPKPITTFIDTFSDKRAIFPNDIKDLNLLSDAEVSIKFNVGTEVFFIKTSIKSHLNRYYFDMTSKVIQLKRRKEPRLLIPKKWNQTASIVFSIVKQAQLKCTVIDISLSGIRLEVEDKQTTAVYNRDDIIKIKFQIYKRAEITTAAIVRFVLNRPGMPIIIGLEFSKIPELQKMRVASIIEDINLFNSVNKN